ncbi:MAG: hypothetical protein JXJ04_13240 [Spirochaetales bacterium]|nr:hypothetical protein [Spirochaetales bacterium]
MVPFNFHEFHFVMSRTMKEKLKNLDIYKKAGNLSGLIVKVLSVLTPAVRREHQWGKQRMSQYRSVSNDTEEIREHVHVYFPENVYREVKLMHADLNFFSIAQLIRGLLEFFLGLMEEYGDNVYQILEKLFSRWAKDAEKNRLTLSQYIRQLWRIIQHIPPQNRFINIYNQEFSPFWKIRL